MSDIIIDHGRSRRKGNVFRRVSSVDRGMEKGLLATWSGKPPTLPRPHTGPDQARSGRVEGVVRWSGTQPPLRQTGPDSARRGEWWSTSQVPTPQPSSPSPSTPNPEWRPNPAKGRAGDGHQIR